MDGDVEERDGGVTLRRVAGLQRLELSGAHLQSGCHGARLVWFRAGTQRAWPPEARRAPAPWSLAGAGAIRVAMKHVAGSSGCGSMGAGAIRIAMELAVTTGIAATPTWPFVAMEAIGSSGRPLLPFLFQFHFLALPCSSASSPLPGGHSLTLKIAAEGPTSSHQKLM